MRLLLNSKNNSQQGFTIVELIVTMLVGASLIGSVHSIYINQLYLSQRTRDTVVLNAFVEAKVEALRSQGYLSVALGGPTDISSELPVELNAGSASMTVTANSTAVKQIQISVSFNEQGTSRSYTYLTYIGELGVGQ